MEVEIKLDGLVYVIRETDIQDVKDFLDSIASDVYAE